MVHKVQGDQAKYPYLNSLLLRSVWKRPRNPVD